MKGLLKLLGRIFVFLLFISLLAVSVLAFYFYNNMQTHIDNVYSQYQQQNISEEAKPTTLESTSSLISKGFDYLNAQLNVKDERIKDLEGKVAANEQEGFGEIEGSILPFVTRQSDLTQYQRVCAQGVDNLNMQYCISVSAIQKDYSLIVPNGNYLVFAFVQGDNEAQAYKAYYTEYVRCNQQNEANCDEGLSDEKLEVKVESGQTVSNIDPADWKFSTDQVEETEE